jgi:hypothetical protein
MTKREIEFATKMSKEQVTKAREAGKSEKQQKDYVYMNVLVWADENDDPLKLTERIWKKIK